MRRIVHPGPIPRIERVSSLTFVIRYPWTSWRSHRHLTGKRELLQDCAEGERVFVEHFPGGDWVPVTCGRNDPEWSRLSTAAVTHILHGSELEACR